MMNKISKLLETFFVCGLMFGARMFGDYLHTLHGPNQPAIAVYRWRGKTWWIPTGAVEDPE